MIEAFVRLVALCLALTLSAGTARAECLDLGSLGSRTGRRVDLPAMQFLDIMLSRRSAPGLASIEAYPELPNGGIAGRHLCGVVQVLPFQGGRLSIDRAQRGELLAATTIQLRQRLDVGRDYPAFARRIVQSGQLRQVAGGSWIAWQLPPGADVNAKAAELVPSQGCAGAVIAADRTLLVPVC